MIFRPLVFYIGLRYTRPKRKDRFVSFISFVSILGIIIGVATLVCVLSVMNGFDYQIRSKIFHLAPQILITAPKGGVTDWQSLASPVKGVAHVKAMAPYVQGYAMIKRHRAVHPIMLSGVDPLLQSKVSHLSDHMISGHLSSLKAGRFGMVVGESTALALGVGTGDKVNVFTPNVTVTPLGVWPQVKPFTIVGVYRSVGRLGYDRSMALIHMRDAQALYHMGHEVSGVRLSVDDLYIAPKVAHSVAKALHWRYVVTDWTEQYASFFSAIAMEKNMMFLILMLIVAVAVFNLVSTMVMIVNDKRGDIAILRTLGASPRMILLTFVVQGSFIGALGTALGVWGGVLLTHHVNALMHLLQRWLGVQFISSSVYFIDFLPTRIHSHDVWLISGVTFLLSVLATVYPAWRAAKIMPAEVLRYA